MGRRRDTCAASVSSSRFRRSYSAILPSGKSCNLTSCSPLGRNLLPLYFSLFEPPTVDGLAIEAPLAAELESRDALLLEQTVDRRRMDAEIIRELSHRHNWT